MKKKFELKANKVENIQREKSEAYINQE